MSEENATPESTETQQPPATSQGETQTNEGQSTTFTQADVDRIVGERAKRASEAAINKVLESLGVDSVDAAKSVIEAEKQRKEAEMTELEKRDLRIKALEDKFNEQVAANEQLKQQRLNDLRDNGLLQLLGKAHDSQKVLLLLKGEKSEAVSGLINEDGSFDSKTAEKLIADYEKDNAYLFQSGAPGSPSNNNGRAPDANKAAKDAARSESIKRLRRNV